MVRRGLLALGVLAVAAGAAAGYAVLSFRSTLSHTLPAPESPTGLRPVTERRFPHGLVVAAHPEAVRLGAQVLARGGSALDAAVTVQAALTLVEPQSSGLGGGAFLLYWDAQQGRLYSYDGRETAPASATPELFLDAAGAPLTFPEALVGGRSVGVPGVVRLLALAHARHGRQQWSSLFTGPAELAQAGFAVTPRLHALLALDSSLPTLPALRRLFLSADGWPLPVGARLSNPALAATFRALAAGGPEAFYGGPLAAEMVEAVRTARQPSQARVTFDQVARQLGVAATGEADVPAPGGLSLADLAGYRAVERDPLCVSYRRFRLCSVAPPAGGVSVLQAMKLLERFDLSALTPGSADEAHLLVEALALVDADRQRWVADPNFAPVPTGGLLDPAYLAERGGHLSLQRALGAVEPGQPPGARGAVQSGQAFEVPSTSHFVVVDGQGSIACMTTSIEFGFGAHVLAGGFLLNNQLTDFAFTPTRDGRPVFNAVEAGKRPRSSMSPVIVFEQATGKPVLAVGSPGGSRIVGYVVQALVGVLDHQLSLDAALAQPHVVQAAGVAEVEDVGWPSPAARDEVVEALRQRGHQVTVGPQNSGLHGVALGAALTSGVDPRREGEAAGY
jgi:gamma-glutamyltranspeptidase / glutathione hydrolase